MTEKSGTGTEARELPFGLAVRAIVRDREGRILLVRRSRANKSSPGVWEFPGGKIDPGENFAAALVREVKEECGLNVIPTRAVGAVQTETPGIHVVHVMMETQLVSGAVRLSEEHDEHAWLLPADVSARAIISEMRTFATGYATERS